MAFMYHVASSEQRESIAANGLLASLDSTGFGAVFLADALPKDCSGFDIWVVDVDGLALEDDHTGEPEHGSWWMHFGDIKPERLTIHAPDLSPKFSPSMF